MSMPRKVWRGAGSAAIATVLAVTSIAGCSHSPREEARKGLESLHSWAVSTQMVGERWRQSAVPRPYAGRALSSFRKKMLKQRGKIASETLPSELKRYLLSGFDSTVVATDSLRAMVQRGERGDAARIVSSLSARASAADSAKARIHGT
jgi:hypothetical protein